MTGAPPLPPGSYLFGLWKFPPDFGGLSRATMQHVRLFQTSPGAAPVLLTFAFDPRIEELRAQLVAEGEISDAAVLRNLYEDLRDGRLNGPADPDAPLASTLLLPGMPGVRLEHGPDGSVARVAYRSIGADYYRPDGTRYLSVRDTEDEFTPGIVVHDAAGRVSRTFRDEQELFHAWLDLLRGDGECFVVIESGRRSLQLAAAAYRRPRTSVVAVMHTSHLDAPGGHTAPLASIGKGAYEKLHLLDGLVLLTERQRREVAERFGDRTNLFAMPHPVDPPENPPADPVDPHVIAMLARLDENKQVSHVIRALPPIAESFPDVKLEIYGEGAERGALEALAAELEQTDRVEFKGHVSGAAERYGEVGVSVLTSASEARPVVITEALARGCPFVAYDIAYGPSDQIEPGVNGFLVRPGDIAGLADAVVTVLRDTSGRLRAGARASIEQFTPHAVLQRWGALFRTTIEQRPLRTTIDAMFVGPTRQVLGPEALELGADVVVAGSGREATLGTLQFRWLLRGRETKRPVELPVTVTDNPALLQAAVVGSVPTAVLRDLLSDNSAVDVFLTLAWQNSYAEARLSRAPHSSVAAESAAPDDLDAYTTEAGNLSVRSRLPELPEPPDPPEPEAPPVTAGAPVRLRQHRTAPARGKRR